jgi:hypothetical protein
VGSSAPPELTGSWEIDQEATAELAENRHLAPDDIAMRVWLFAVQLEMKTEFRPNGVLVTTTKNEEPKRWSYEVSSNGKGIVSVRAEGTDAAGEDSPIETEYVIMDADHFRVPSLESPPFWIVFKRSNGSPASDAVPSARRGE